MPQSSSADSLWTEILCESLCREKEGKTCCEIVTDCSIVRVGSFVLYCCDYGLVSRVCCPHVSESASLSLSLSL